MHISIEEEKEYRLVVAKMLPTKIKQSLHVSEYIYKLPEQEVVVQILVTNGKVEDGHLEVFTLEEWVEHTKPMSLKFKEMDDKIENLAHGTDEEKAQYAEHKSKMEEIHRKIRKIQGIPEPIIDGIRLITNERARHTKLGYDAHHDSHEIHGELAVAAGLYALDGTYAMGVINEVAEDLPDEDNPIKNELWPWEDMPDKRGKMDRIHQLAMAGALIAAEIDRLLKIKKNNDNTTGE